MGKVGAKGVSTLIEIDRDCAVPVYRQIADRLRIAIEAERLGVGERLASTRALSRDWGVSRNTVVQVFDVLIAEGYLESRVGDGTYVSWARLGGEDPAAAPARRDVADHAESGYPFRELSRRGRSLAQRASEGVSEQPLPFMPDVPDLSEFPLRSWLRLMNEVAGRLTGRALVGLSSAGYMPLRQAIAHHLGVSRGLRCEPEQVIVTSGSQQGLDLATRLLVDRGEPVWLEEPGYVGARAALRANGCNVLSVPLDDEGIDLAYGRDNLIAPRLICVSPAR
ncbi:MAG: PLP-dependent aminotransferase family protein, partial [Pseudomonadota bacterium]